MQDTTDSGFLREAAAIFAFNYTCAIRGLRTGVGLHSICTGCGVFVRLWNQKCPQRNEKRKKCCKEVWMKTPIYFSCAYRCRKASSKYTKNERTNCKNLGSLKEDCVDTKLTNHIHAFLNGHLMKDYCLCGPTSMILWCNWSHVVSIGDRDRLYSKGANKGSDWLIMFLS